MLAIFRHADRTPKSKLKAVVHHQYFVDFFEMYRNKKGKGGEKSGTVLSEVSVSVPRVPNCASEQ